MRCDSRRKKRNGHPPRGGSLTYSFEKVGLGSLAARFRREGGRWAWKNTGVKGLVFSAAVGPYCAPLVGSRFEDQLQRGALGEPHLCP